MVALTALYKNTLKTIFGNFKIWAPLAPLRGAVKSYGGTVKGSETRCRGMRSVGAVEE